jgi:hypothetical protein
MTRRARMLVVLALLAVTVTAAFPAGGIAAKPELVTVDDTYFIPSFCGASVTAHDLGHLVTSVAGNVETDRYEFHTTVTTDSGVVVTLHYAGTISGTINPVPNGDGTYSVSTTYHGLAEQWKLPGGRVLTRDAGVLAITDTLDSAFNVLNTQLAIHGPHPEADSGFGLECQILSPILVG